MGSDTGIEWTDSTWNAVRGCSRVSEGCRNCYAESVAHRFSGPGKPYEGLTVLGQAKWNGKIKFVEEHLLDPLRWKKPRKIFVNSMSDLFHEGVTDEMLDKMFAVMALCPQHTFQCLTKRPKRMLAYLTTRSQSIQFWESAARELGYTFKFNGLEGKEHSTCPFPLPNVWLGVSVENQKAAIERLDSLCEIAVQGWQTMISFEPLLGPVDFEGWIPFLGKTWAIVGGESGPGARPMHPDWARSLRDQCVAGGVPFFFKQWGEMYPSNDGDGFKRIGKKAAGHLLDGQEWHQFPEVSVANS